MKIWPESIFPDFKDLDLKVFHNHQFISQLKMTLNNNKYFLPNINEKLLRDDNNLSHLYLMIHMQMPSMSCITVEALCFNKKAT